MDDCLQRERWLRPRLDLGDSGWAIADDLDEALRVLTDACRTLARESKPFLPAASELIARALASCDPKLGRRLFAKAL